MRVPPCRRNQLQFVSCNRKIITIQIERHAHVDSTQHLEGASSGPPRSRQPDRADHSRRSPHRLRRRPSVNPTIRGTCSRSRRLPARAPMIWRSSIGQRWRRPSRGYAPDVVSSAVAQATMSVNTRGNRVGKCSLILDAQSVFVLTKEFGTGHLNRQAVQTLWAGGDSLVRDLVPAAHAKMMASGESGSIEAADAASSCCTVLGNAIGTCCRYDFQGLFECCGPCGFTFPEIGLHSLRCHLVQLLLGGAL